jgi:hypothetical protein
MSLELKYLKYKNKYLNLKNQLGGSINEIEDFFRYIRDRNLTSPNNLREINDYIRTIIQDRLIYMSVEEFVANIIGLFEIDLQPFMILYQGEHRFRQQATALEPPQPSRYQAAAAAPPPPPRYQAAVAAPPPQYQAAAAAPHNINELNTSITVSNYDNNNFLIGHLRDHNVEISITIMNNRLYIVFINSQYGNIIGETNVSLTNEEPIRNIIIPPQYKVLIIKILNDLINYLQGNSVFNVTTIQNKLILNYLYNLLRLMRQIDE